MLDQSMKLDRQRPRLIRKGGKRAIGLMNFSVSYDAPKYVELLDLKL